MISVKRALIMHFLIFLSKWRKDKCMKQFWFSFLSLRLPLTQFLSSFQFLSPCQKFFLQFYSFSPISLSQNILSELNFPSFSPPYYLSLSFSYSYRFSPPKSKKFIKILSPKKEEDSSRQDSLPLWHHQKTTRYIWENIEDERKMKKEIV